MITIYKYELKALRGVFAIKLPVFCEILCVQVQYGVPVLYVKHDTNLPAIEHRISTFFTGEQLPDTYTGAYISTYTIDDLVYHAFYDVVPV